MERLTGGYEPCIPGPNGCIFDECAHNKMLNRLAAYEDTGLTSEEVAELAKAKKDGRLLVLPCKVEQLKAQYDKLTEQMGDEAETYTTGYRNGHKNGQAEMIAYLLQLDIGTRAEAEAALQKEAQHE